MATSNKSKYSTYAGLDTEAPVNWGSVANTISKQVNLFNEKRKADQQAVEDATQSAIEKLNELPDVNNQSLDKALLDSAKSQQEQLMMNMKLVRKGVFKMHDYKMRMNEMKNGYTNFKNITKVYDGWWTAAQERVKNNTATEADKAFMKRIESFGNLNNKKFMTNPANGQLQVVTMGKDDKGQYTIMPDPKKNPEAFQNPGVILDMMKYDGGVKVDLDEATNNIVDNLGEMMTAYVTPDGKTYTLTDFRQMFNDETRLKKLGLPEGITTFDQWLDSQAEAFVGNDADMAQILATQAGYQFDDPSKANYIELKGTGNTVEFGKDGKGLSEDERKKAKDIVKRMIANKMDSKQTAQRGFDDRENVKEKEDRGISFDIAYDVTSGGKPSSAAAIEKIKANNDTISNIYKDPTTNEFVIQYSDGSSPKRIKPATKMVNGEEVYDAKESAVSLMAAVTPGGDVVTAEKARDEYKGGDKTYVNEFNTDKIKVSASNSSTGFMNATKTVDGKIVPVSISESFEEIATSDTGIDEDSAPLYNKLFKGLALEEGTENLISNISVVPSPRSTQSDDVIRVTGLPPEVMALIDTSDIVFSGDTEHGDDYIEVSVEELDSSG